MRVCIFVANPCTVDSRVLRQAGTFARAGHETVVVAVRRGDLPSVESRDGFEIRRVSTTWTWSEGYPRIARVITAPARLVGRRRRATASQPDPPALGGAPSTGPGARDSLPEAPLPPRSEEAAPEPAGAPLAPAAWLRWLATGRGPAPRSWDGERASPADRLRFLGALVAGLPGWILRRARRLARKGYRFARRTALRARRLTLRRVLLPTRYRQLDRRMAREAVRFRADLYWANDVTTLRAARAAARATGGRSVYDAHELIWDAPTVAPLQQRLWGLVERVNIGKVDRVFTVCEPIARVLATRYRIDPPTVILNCPRLADTAGTPPPEASPLNALRRPGERLVLFHGSLSPWRGLEQLVQAVALLPEEYRLVIMGYGPFLETLRGLAAQQGPSARITFVDPVPPGDLPAWLAGADMGTIPYQRHGLNHEYSTPNKLFEYMHAGVPVVVNDLPEIRRIVSEVGFGVVCDCSDPPAIAKAIQDVVSDPARYRAMRDRARAAASAYSWEPQEQTILSALSV